MLLACVFFLLPGSAIWEAKAKQNTGQQRGGNNCYSSRFLSTSEQISWHCRGTEGHRKTTQSSVRLLENCPIMVSACWGYMLWYRQVQVPLMLWRPFSWQLHGSYIHVQLQRSLGNAWAWRPHRCEMCSSWGTESFSGGAEGRGGQVVCHQGKWKGGWVSLHWKLAETTAWAIQSSKVETVWGHGQKKKWRFTLKMERAGTLWVLVPASLADLQLQKTF